MEISEEVRASVALGQLALQLRRHYYHRPYETAPDDLIDEGIVVNLEWDERDAIWVQFDTTVTLEIPSIGSPLGIYAEEGPVVTLWRAGTPDGFDWKADWDADLTHSDRQRFLRKLSDRASLVTGEVEAFLQAYLNASSELEKEDRQETADVAREWLLDS